LYYIFFEDDKRRREIFLIFLEIWRGVMKEGGWLLGILPMWSNNGFFYRWVKQ